MEQQTPAIGSSVAHEEEVFVPSPDPNMITIQSTSSAEPLNVRPVTAEEVELHGDIKIQKVARTRWTPQKKSTEQVQRSNSTPLQTPPTEVPPPLVSYTSLKIPYMYSNTFSTCSEQYYCENAQ